MLWLPVPSWLTISPPVSEPNKTFLPLYYLSPEVYYGGTTTTTTTAFDPGQPG